MANTKPIIHGCSRRTGPTLEYRAWGKMLTRCNNPSQKSYRNYGARGIRVCERWLKFENFLADMGERPGPEFSLDRIDNNGNYEPSNCRWATKKIQNRNRRGVILVSFNGETKSIAEWAEKLGINYFALRSRIKRGMPVERALKKERYQSGPKSG